MVSENETYKIIGTKLRTLRESRGQTQYEVGRLLGYEAATVGRYETGERRISIPDLIALAKYYGVPITYFWDEASDEDRLAAKFEKLEEQFRLLWEEAKRLGEEMEKREDEKSND